MRRSIIGLMIVIVVAITVPRAHASNVGFNFGIDIGNTPAPVYASPPVEIEEPPEFEAQPALGFYAAVGTPYNLFYAANRYYLCRGNEWYAASYYNGPWVQVQHRALPWGLRRYPIAKMRYIRDEGWRHYRDDDNYDYRHFRPDWHAWRERHARWEGEKPCEAVHHRHDRHWVNDDED